MYRPTSIFQQSRTILAVTIARAVSLVLRLLSRGGVRKAAAYIPVCVGLALQVGLCLVTMYLIDLSISLFELWTDLAQKHLELTL